MTTRPIHPADVEDCRGLVSAALDMFAEGIERFGGVDEFLAAHAAWRREQAAR